MININVDKTENQNPTRPIRQRSLNHTETALGHGPNGSSALDGSHGSLVKGPVGQLGHGSFCRVHVYLTLVNIVMLSPMSPCNRQHRVGIMVT